VARFPAISLAFDAIRAGGTMGAVLNAANEAAVAAFTSGKASFGEISRLVGFTMSRHAVRANPSLEDLLEADQWARKTVAEKVAGASK